MAEEKMELPEGVSKEQAEEFLKNQPVVFKVMETGPNSHLRIHRTLYRGKLINSIQKFWRESEYNEWQFGKAITFKYEDIDDLLDGLKKMKAFLEEHPDEED